MRYGLNPDSQDSLDQYAEYRENLELLKQIVDKDEEARADLRGVPRQYPDMSGDYQLGVD
jgi:hypothetical protein